MGDKVPSKDERSEPPAGWIWEDDWTIDANRAVDEEGKSFIEFEIEVKRMGIQVLNIVSIKHWVVGVQQRNSFI